MRPQVLRRALVVAFSVALVACVGCKKKVELGTYPGSISARYIDETGKGETKVEKDIDVVVTGSGDKVSMTLLGCTLDGAQLGAGKVRFEPQECAVGFKAMFVPKPKLGGEATMDPEGGLLTIDVKDPNGVWLEFAGMRK